MRIRFFGDSWYWAWYQNEQTFNSNTIKNRLLRQRGLPIFETYCNFFNHVCISHCKVSNNFYQTVDSVLQTTEHWGTKYNVVFFSSLLRNHNTEEIAKKLDVTNYDNFIYNFNTETVRLLSTLQEWAEKNNQQILILGSQCTLYKSVYEQVPKRSNIHLLTECILSTLNQRYYNQKTHTPFGIFKFSQDFSNTVDNTYDKKLVNQIFEDQQRIKKSDVYKNFVFPDNAHLNPSGALMALDLILHKIEELQEKKDEGFSLEQT